MTIQLHVWHQPNGPGTRWEMDVEEVTVAETGRTE